MEIRNDKILKFTGRSPNDVYDFDNIYSPDGIGIQLINSNTQISFINTSPISINTSKLNINFRNSNINLINSNGLLNFNNLSITNSGFVGINSTIPQSSLDVSGRITCFDINLSNSIITSNLINKLGTSINDINSGILSSNCGGTNKSSFQNGQIIFGNNQTQFLNWDDDLKRVGIGMTNPQHSLDINGNINGLFFRTYGRFINDGFSTKDDVSRSSNSSYFASSNNSYKSSYNYTTIFKSELNDKIIDYEIWKKYSYGRNYTNLKVGIGNANPTSSLFISGDLNYTGNLRRFGKNIRTFNGDFNDLYNSPGVCWNLSNENIFKANTGSVGIGTTAIPLTMLDINGGINFGSNIKQNGNIMKFFDGNYDNLNNLPNISLFGYSGSFYHLTETPEFFNSNYYYLTDIPSTFNVDWNKTISNLPKLFKTDWNTTIDNIPDRFDVDWNSNIYRKPINFPTDWDTTIANLPEFFVADWDKSVSNKPRTFDTDWTFNVLNKPNFSKLAYTGEYNDVLNKPYIFSGDYNDLSNKPKYAEVCFTGNYYDLCNQPRLFNGDYNYLSNIPTYFKTNWNSTILNLPDFKKVAFTGSYNDLIDEPIDNWGENGTHIFSCNSINIGIGNSNPLYNLDISSNFFIDSSFKVVFSDIIVNNPPWAYYLPENWDNSSILRDASGNNNDARTSGTITKLSASGNGATTAITYLSGNTSSSISFPSGSLSSNYTILSLTRYTGGSRGRILQSQTGNWLHGHWNSSRGVCHYDGWKTNYTNVGNVDDWLCCIGKNSSSTPNNILLDGVASGIASGGGSNYQLGINLGIPEYSDWGFGCLFIWDKHLSDDDMIKLSDIIKNYLKNNGSINNYIKNIFVYDECYLSNSLNINNQNFSNAFGVISEYNRTANWLNSGINAYNKNSGNIGIGTFEPSASYKLDVIGAINTDSNLNLSSSGAIFWSSYGTTGIGCAGVDGQYSTSSLAGDLVIRSGEGKKLILQNGSNISFFFINSGNIGMGTSSPTSLLHIHNSNSNMEMKILLTDGSTGISSTNGFSLFKDSNGVANIWNYVNRHLRFGTNNIDRMFIKNDGFIGIGTTNPLSILHFHNSNNSGEVKLSLNGFSIYKDGTNDDGFIWNNSNNSLRFGTNNKENLMISNSGNIGIGFTNPSSIFHFHNSNSNGEVKLLFTDSSTGTASNNGFSVYKDSNKDGFIWNYSNVAIKIGTNNLERLCIQSSENIGIGITNPSSIFHLHNSNASGEVKILFTDGSTGTASNNGFSIYKDSNEDGFIWNYSNVAVRFGTNNIENMSILNNGNIGIGITNPSSILHLHNTSSNGEIRLLLTDASTGIASNNGLLIHKSSNEDGIIWNNTNNPLKIGIIQTTPSYTMTDFLSPWAFYSAENFSGSTLSDTSGNSRNASTSGTITKSSGSGNGSINSINFISGDTSSTISFPTGSLPTEYTILSLTRYTGGTRGRILQSQTGNWLHGHWNGNRGVCHYDAWKTSSGNVGNVDDWLCCIGKNGGLTPNNILIDGVPSGTDTGGVSGYRLSINIGVNEKSDWSLSYLIIWNKHLTYEEMLKMNNYFNIVRGIENLTISNSGNIGIGINTPSSLLHLHNSNFSGEVRLLLTDGSTGTASNNGFSIYKSSNEEVYLWNFSAKSLNFGIFKQAPSYSMTDFLNPWGFYSAENFSGTTLSDTSGNSNHATTSGTITKSSASGNGSINSINFISGGTTATLSFPTGSIPSTFTILSLTRYTGGTSGRILQSQTSNWFHGHYNGNRGVCYYTTWITNSTNVGNVNDWLCCIGRNSTSTFSNNILIDGVSSATNYGGNGNFQLAINIGVNEKSDWALAYVIIWNKHLTDNEMIKMNNYINVIRGIENLTISNSGNIGLGINTPSSLLHLHNNLNVSGEVKILLTDGNTGTASNNGFSIYKDSNNDGNIWNYGNNSLKIGIKKSIPSYSMTDFLNPWGFYSADNFSGSNLNDTSGNNRHATITGTITISSGSGNGSVNSINYISGGVDSYITFPTGSIPSNFTILSLTKYNGPNKRKILTAKKSSSTDDTEWYHGHNSGLTGLCYYSSWITSSSGINGNADDWVCVIGKNGGSIPNNVLINGANSGTNTGGTGNKQLGINFPNNDWTYTAGYEYYPYWWWPSYIITVPERRDVYESRSDWALSHVIIWDKHLTTDEMIKMNNYINLVLGNENITISSSGNIGLGINTPSSHLHLHNSSGEVKLLLTDPSTGVLSTNGLSIYKSSSEDGFIWNYPNSNLRFGTSNTIRLSIFNDGKIGIGTVYGSSYQLNINGTLNGYYLRGDGNSITSLSFSKITTGFLPVGLTGTGKNTLEVNQILFGNDSSPLGQSANLYWDNANTLLGINKTNPSTTLDVNGTITATSFTGSGLSISNINTANFSSGSLPVGSGGTGKSIYTSGQILFGNSNSNIDSSTNLFWDNTTSKLGINKTNPASNLDVSGTITGTFNGNGSAITSLNATNFSSGTLGTERGGTGTSTLASGQILIANDTSAIYTSANLFWDNGNSYLGINKTNPSSNLDVNGTITGTFSGSGSNINSLDATNFSSGTLGIANGGIGTSNLSNGRILFGNTTSALNSSKDLFWNNDNVGLGIGTTIPKYSLEAIGDINFTGDLKRNGVSYTGDQGVWTSSGSNIYFNSGNIEIGSEIPSNPNRLNIVGTLNCISYRIQNADLDILPSKVYLHLGWSSVGGSQLLYNNNSFIRYAYGGLTTESGTFYLNIEVLYFRVSSTSTKSTQGFWFDNGSIGIGTRPDITMFRLRVSNGTSNNYVISSKITYFDKFNAILSNLPSGVTIPILSTIFQGNTVCNGVFYFAYFSDIRIKNDINDINSSYALNLINKIKPKSFKYIDYIEKGHNDNYGFIAQEIKELLPEAITYNKEYIPNVFKLFDINKDIININEDLTGLLNIDDEIQIIDTKNKIDCKILEITSSYIKIDKSLEDDKIFVYGKKVDDFHVLNKEYIFTLNISATQELHKKLEIQEKRIQELDKLLEEEDRKLREQEEKIEFLLNNFF
jgi:hypothetical protein